ASSGAAERPPRVPEAALLADALGREGRLISREAAGVGAIAGFAVDDDGAPLTVYVDTSRQPVDEETGMVLPAEPGDEGRGPAARIWVHPADPYLPALGPAAFSDATAALLSRLGIDAPHDSRMLAYRAGKRAVIRLAPVDGGEARYLKVVRPERAERIWSVHRRLGAAGLPVPAVGGWSPAGLLVIDEARGEAGIERAARLGDAAEARALVAAIDGLRRALAASGLAGDARPSLALRADWYFERLAGRGLDAPLARLRAVADGRPREAAAPVPMHGDLHLGQLFFEGGAAAPRVSGLIDVDTAGLGDPADDAGAFAAHALVAADRNAARGNAPAAAGLERLVDAAAEAWLDEAAARAVFAVHAVAHAGGAAELGGAEPAARILDRALAAL
ncbi:MAG: phosphotransferase, partial [Microbacteriaceae bacterium]|nr:phosphotransferase [Microbacteriaceae bacterium]